MPEQAGLSVEAIPQELIGQNIDYKVLVTPSDPRRPKGNEVRYSDDYTRRLNEAYHLNDVLGDNARTISNGQIPQSFVYQESVQGTDSLMRILRTSVQAGSWQPEIVDYDFPTNSMDKMGAEPYLERISNDDLNTRTIWVYGVSLFGVEILKRAGLVLPIVYQNKVIAIPSQKLIEHIAKQKDSS